MLAELKVWRWSKVHWGPSIVGLGVHVSLLWLESWTLGHHHWFPASLFILLWNVWWLLWTSLGDKSFLTLTIWKYNYWVKMYVFWFWLGLKIERYTILMDVLPLAGGCLEGSEIPLDAEEVRHSGFSLSPLRKKKHYFKGLCFYLLNRDVLNVNY